MTLDDHIQIEEILAEANAYGLKSEVFEAAQKLMTDGYGQVEAYSIAFTDWVK